MMMVQFLACINSFFCGAICMLIALCIQPEAVEFIRKVYYAEIEKKVENRGRPKGSKNKPKEGCLLLQKRLDRLYDLTREQCNDQLDEQVSEAWTDVDNSIAVLLGKEEADEIPSLHED
jgi:lipopolysaccharide export LptBFGC system permease protein LptF